MKLLIVNSSAEGRPWAKEIEERTGAHCIIYAADSPQSFSPDFDAVVIALPADTNVIQELKSKLPLVPVLGATDTWNPDSVQQSYKDFQDIIVLDEANPKTLRRIVQSAKERLKLLSTILHNEKRYSLALQSIQSAVWDWNLPEHKIWDWNLPEHKIHFSFFWKNILDYDESQMSSDPAAWLEKIHPDDREEFERILEEIQAAVPGSFSHDHRIQHHNGSYLWVRLQGMSLADSEGKITRLVGTLKNIHEQKTLDEQQNFQAFHDPLTGLPSRSLFVNRLEQAFRRFKRHPQQTFAVLSIDLDRFKVINDGLGQAFGDQLLTHVAKRLETCVREVDTIARLGADEFFILLDPVVDMNGAVVVAERIRKALIPPFHFLEKQFFISGSIGIALTSYEDTDAEDLIRHSNLAMHGAKNMGGGKYKIFDTEMHERAIARLHKENELRQAIERQDFILHYQPIVDLKKGNISGLEALVRWKHPERGMIPPLEFIPLAEETSLIIPIGKWVLREACRQMALWQKHFSNPLCISVNVSYKQLLHGDFVDEVAHIIKETKIQPGSLCLELTESGILQNSEMFFALFAELRALQVEFHIDDFGTGYSSLSYLYKFQFDKLKIDRSFLSPISETNKNPQILSSIVGLAHHLNIPTIAEGIETVAKLNQLRELDCEYGQGFYFAPPLSFKNAEELITTNPRW
jgi:diguanylate cyclase (GGDEF)-like protein